MKNIIYAVAIMVFAGCGTSNRVAKTPIADVGIAITINSENSSSVNFVNTDYFKFRLLDELEDFQSVNFILVDKGDDPEVVLNINIDNFVLWPRDERRSRRTVSRRVAVGTDAAGKPIFQTVSATVDIVQVQRRSNARFVANLTIKDQPPFNFQRSFAPSYNYVNTYVDNVYGDPRAVDASLSMARGMGIEPLDDDFLLILANREMTRRLSDELRKYYNNKAKKNKIE